MKYFVYYSATGNGDYLAQLLEEKGYTPIKVEMVKPIGKIGFFKIIKYGGHAMQKRKAPIKDLNINFKEEDEVVIGSPIWNDRLSTPINAVLAKLPLNKETTKFILYPAGEGTKKSIKQLSDLGFKIAPLVISYPLKKQEQARQLLENI